MHRPSVALAIALASLAAAEAGQAQEPAPPQPTLQFDGSCFTEGQAIPYSGASYTPDGEVDLLLGIVGSVRGSVTAHADASGALSGWFEIDQADDVLRPHEEREAFWATANDRTRIDAGEPDESQFGAGQFTFTRWEASAQGRFTPGKRTTVQMYGWAFATGKPAWLLFRKGSRTVASIPVGHLDNECGDLKAKVKVPRRLKLGRYRVVLTADRTLQGAYMWRSARVTRGARAAAAASGSRAMKRHA